MSSFSPKTTRLLKHAGWYSGRQIDASQYDEIVHAKGLPVYEASTRFLQEFGGLTFFDPDRDWGGNWHFRVEDAIARADSRRILKRHSPLVGSALTVIGDSCDEYLLLLMDENGRVYGDYDSLFFVGSSGYDAIEAICINREMPEFEDTESLEEIIRSLQ